MNNDEKEPEDGFISIKIFFWGIWTVIALGVILSFLKH